MENFIYFLFISIVCYFCTCEKGWHDVSPGLFQVSGKWSTLRSKMDTSHEIRNMRVEVERQSLPREFYCCGRGKKKDGMENKEDENLLKLNNIYEP